MTKETYYNVTRIVLFMQQTNAAWIHDLIFTENTLVRGGVGIYTGNCSTNAVWIHDLIFTDLIFIMESTFYTEHILYKCCVDTRLNLH
jgi:hypothetical protein